MLSELLAVVVISCMLWVSPNSPTFFLSQATPPVVVVTIHLCDTIGLGRSRPCVFILLFFLAISGISSNPVIDILYPLKETPMEGLLNQVSDSPIVAFTVLLMVTLTIPPLFERLRLPGLVGLLAAGVLLGPSALGLLSPDGEIEKLLSDIGKIYLMFVAGLEIDLQEFKKNRNRSLGFGILTFLLPLLAGMTLGRTVWLRLGCLGIDRFAVGLSYPAGLPHCVAVGG